MAKRAQKEDPVNFKIHQLRSRLSTLAPVIPTPSGLGTWNGDRKGGVSPFLEIASSPRVSQRPR
eukprot:CAMPEP_0170482710 /NCGR_PEP_ID=MMETSP0208-20121228/2606_1 /TAXON_ID=197538 /ORGANISM="Strombidium inclinatum, Strain S3" /LENGTH=63 /DNA_ID=CAMNT_0010755573 /DNA_START=772 /DNA_END=963 /DNA_ORIENTATION=-